MANPSPTPNYPPYSPTAASHPRPFYSHDQPHNGPSPTHHLPSSPHRPITFGSPLPHPSSNLPPTAAGSIAYQPLNSSPTYQTQRTYSGHLMSTASMPPQPEGSSIPTGHGHPANRPSSMLRSPVRDQRPLSNGYAHDTPSAELRPQSHEKPDRASNPMSFASILGPSNNEPAPKAPEVKPPPVSAVVKSEQSVQPAFTSQEPKTVMHIQPPPVVNGSQSRSPLQDTLINGARPTAVVQSRKKLTNEEIDRIQRAIIEIEDTDYSDTDTGGLHDFRQMYARLGQKRSREVEKTENNKRKRRRTLLLDQFVQTFTAHASAASGRFRDKFEAAAVKEINDKDVHDEKERKKDMQRKRRREHQIKAEKERLEHLQQSAQNAYDRNDHEGVQRYKRQVEKSEAKIRQTTELLEGGGAALDDIEAPAIPPNLEGGITSAFHLGSEEPSEPPKKKFKPTVGGNNRPKKSKEQKQAEKDAAQAAYDTGWNSVSNNGSALVNIAPKDDAKRESSKPKKQKAEALANGMINYESKGYNQIYEQIVRDLARKDVPRVYRIKQNSLNVRQENMRKTAILASKQARKWQERTNKSMKDTQARAKRVMREMMSFWKRNEREERDLRRMAERKEIEDAKKAEADREANRQRRKLNFLISQTEIYSHFIGKKVKTDEVERATDDPDVAASAQKIAPGDPNAHTIDLPDSNVDLAKVTNFEDLDFDAEDETALRQAAMANAQNAMDEAQAKARAFNGEEQLASMDHGDMNFQNPTMAGDVQVSQPKMLQAQLKEYQLKGLNWLVNLYEQGINGILADEMGLGKTVQSISVMGYLAEAHNIWGPFLVIAPSSTLHNWQQEITKFVPSIKVLPYWGNAKDRKVLRKFWDRKHITYNKDSDFHVLITSYQLVVQDAQYFQKIRWQYMILDEAQAIKSSQSSRWKVLLGFHCRNRLLLTGTPIQNNMQELWALLHFIMPTLFDSHDEFSEWFSKDIESHAQSNTKLNQDQLKRLHMILKPFMLRRVKAHVQKELGEKVEKDVFCDLTYRQRAYYANLRSKISIMDLIEKATLGDDQDTATLMNLVMQFRKVCNHPDLFERADTASPYSMSAFAETASFLREGSFVQVGYSIRNQIRYDLPRILCNDTGRLDIPGPNNPTAGFRSKYLHDLMNVWNAENVHRSSRSDGAFSWLRFVDTSAGEVSRTGKTGLFERAVCLRDRRRRALRILEDKESLEVDQPPHSILNIVNSQPCNVLAEIDPNSKLGSLCNLSRKALSEQGFNVLEPAARPVVSAPPIEVSALDQSSATERLLTLFNPEVRNVLFNVDIPLEQKLLQNDVDPKFYPPSGLLPEPESRKARFTDISVPSMRRFVTDSGKLAKLDQLLGELKNGGHRVLLYFQMTRMIDLMEEYLTYRNYKYCRLDGSTKLEDRRDTVHDFQTRPEIFIFLLSTRAGGLGINLTSADTVIFYDSDWNPTIDSQAMDRAHRLGQTKQVTVYRLITRGTIEERIRKRAMQKEEVQRVVITGGDGGGVDFNTRDRRENRTKDIAMWLADDDQAALIEQKEKEIANKPEDPTGKRKKKASTKRRGEMSLDDMYHEGEGNFDDQSAKASGAATPVSTAEVPSPKKGPRGGSGKSKKAKTARQRLAIIDAEGDLGMSGA